ncbi:MAG: ArsR family transcriptional regulator [Paracoccaceae bacterium]|jgi:ArsR family transcriptional regulator
MKTIHTSDTLIEDAAKAFAALGSEQRLGVLRALVRSGPEGLSIGELGEKTSITGATLTHHVKFLTQAGLVVQTKKGRSIICAAVAYDMIEILSNFLLSECCADAKSTNHEHKAHR